MKRRIAPSISRHPEDGSTLLEVLVGMVVLGLLALVVGGAATASLRHAARLSQAASASARLLLLDDRLRDAVARVSAPWWAAAPAVVAGVDRWTVAFLDGDPGRMLTLENRGGEAGIEDGTRRSTFPGFSLASVEAARDAAGRSIGIAVRIEADGIAPITIVARFGSCALAAGGAP